MRSLGHGHARRVRQHRPLRPGWARGCADFAPPEGFDQKRSERQFARARAARGGRGHRGHPVGVCSAFAVLTHSPLLNERCNVTGGEEGGELGNGQGGASGSSAPACVPPPRVRIHQNRAYPAVHLHVGVVCSPSLPPRAPLNPAHPLTLGGCECRLRPFLLHAPPSRAPFLAQTSRMVPPILVCSA